MATVSNLSDSRLRRIIETSFYGNNVIKVNSLKEAYNLASNSPGTIITDQKIKEPEKYGLPEESKVLLFNDGRILERKGYLRRNYDDEILSKEEYDAEIRELIFQERFRKFYHASVYIGTHREFMVKAHLLIPQGWEGILYNWMLNFQEINEESMEAYDNSLRFKDEGDIFLFGIPDAKQELFPEGLTLFDGDGNAGIISGLNFFAEYKKGTLALAWAIAERNNFIPFHGGQKKYYLSKENSKTALFVGLTGAGKSVLMNHNHRDNLEEEFLHDDALIVSLNNGRSISMEPSYFDKTKDAKFTDAEMEYVLSAQNQSVTLNQENLKIIQGEDSRNDNGRVILAKEAHKNRVLSMSNSPDIIFWLMKDPVLPPVLKVKSPVLSAAFGATLSNMKIKNTDSDLIKETEPLIIQPYANPFRTYHGEKDYIRVQKLITESNIETYILNTGFFMGLEIPKEVSITILDNIISGEGEFTSWNGFSNLEIMEIMGYKAEFSDINYKNYFVTRIRERIDFLKKNAYPQDGINALEKLLSEIV